MTSDKIVSAADIIVAPAAAASETNAAFAWLRQLKRDFARKTRPEAVAALVTGCILEGMETEPCIVGAVIRTARARTSGENLFVVLLVIAPSSQELGPPTNPGWFSDIEAASANGHPS